MGVKYFNNGVIISLNKDFYDKGAIKETIAEFLDIYLVQIQNEDDKNLFISINPKKIKVDETLGYEFCNYVLGLMKNKSIV